VKFECPHCRGTEIKRIQSSDDLIHTNMFDQMTELWQCKESDCKGYFKMEYKLIAIVKMKDCEAQNT